MKIYNIFNIGIFLFLTILFFCVFHDTNAKDWWLYHYVGAGAFIACAICVGCSRYFYWIMTIEK